MKRTSFTSLFLTLIIFAGLSFSGHLAKAQGTGEEFITFNRIWVNHDVYEGGQKGMKIHLDFSIRNFQNIDMLLGVYFEKNGEIVMGNSPSYRSQDGQLAVYKSIKPAYEDSTFSNLTVFFPYNEFTLGTGKHNLQLDADLIYKGGGLVGHLAYYDFTLTK